MLETPLSFITLLSVVGAVLAFTFVPYVRKVAEWFVTIVHELGHGVFSLVTGGGISGISLHSDGSGATTTTHRWGLLNWLTRRIVLFAGYSTPIYLGVFMVILFMNNQSQIAFNILIGVGILTVLLLRNLFGFLIMFTYFASMVVTMMFNPANGMPIFVLFMALLFIIRGMLDLINAGIMVFKHSDNIDIETDFHILQDEGMFYIPAQVWYVFYIVWNTALVTFAMLFFT